jgi:WD40 repeat protein
MTELNNININQINNNYIEETKYKDDSSEEIQNQNQDEVDPNNEIVEYLLPSLEHKIIDSIVSSRNFFVNNISKKIQDNENLIKLRQTLAISDEYKDTIKNENLVSNKYSDKLNFRNKKNEKITKQQIDMLKSPLMITSEEYKINDNYLNKKIVRDYENNNNNTNDDNIITNNNYIESNNFNKPNILNKSLKSNTITNTNSSIAIKTSSTADNSLINIPEKFRKNETSNLNNIIPDVNIDTENSDNSNLFLSLYRNKNHICFRKNKLVTPEWHAPWKLYRVISGHNGWVRCIDIDPSNNWFVTGSNDRVIKFWDLASGKLKLSLTGHINTVRSVKVSNRHPYLFSCGEDKQVKCWDLEQNKVVRHYHGHLSGVYSLTIHPTIDVIITGGRDCVARVWDIRSKQQIMCLEGHNNTISTVVSQEHNPQVITASHDSTLRLWDLGSGKCLNTLTHHKKSIRSVFIHEFDYSFVSGLYK